MVIDGKTRLLYLADRMHANLCKLDKSPEHYRLPMVKKHKLLMYSCNYFQNKLE